MNKDNAGHQVLGHRSKSLGAVLKERGTARGVRTTSEIEYELGHDHAQNTIEEPTSEESRGSNQRVVMMYDEYGNATPMPIGRFYYDNVQTGHSEEAEEGSEPTESQGADTTRANVPAPFKVRRDPSSDSGSSAENAVGHKAELSYPDRRQGQGDAVNDADYGEGSENELEGDDRFANQFMRIPVQASQLKDVSRVKKDLDHDKPQRKRSMMVGLQRAMSSVRIGDTSRTGGAAAPGGGPGLARQPSRARVSAAKIGRLMSFTKTSTEQTNEKASDAEERSSQMESFGRLERERESSASRPKRQGLAAMGRMMSMKKSTTLDKPSSANTAGDRPREGERKSDDRPAQSHTETSGPGKASKRVSLAQVGRMLSLSRSKPAAMSGNDECTVPEKSGLGSKALDTESIHSDVSTDREQRDSRVERNARAPARMGLTKVGRMMSFTRTKKQAVVQPSDGSKQGVKVDSTSPSHLSPMSSSTVSSKAVDGSNPDQGRDASENDRARATCSTNVKKETSTRMNIKAAGRLLSFSRRPHGEAGASQRGRGAEVQEEKKTNEKRAKSVPPKKGSRAGEDESGGARKLDGRASKFFYSELNSERVRATGLLGSETHIRVPVIAMAEYSGPVSKTKWYIDCFTLPHNAVRRECIDLYEIMAGMARYQGNGDITRDDIDDFEDWWKTASLFFKCYFDMERTVLFPWIDGIKAREWDLQVALRKMRTMKDKLREQLCKIDDVWNEKTFKDAGEMYGLLYRAVDEFVPRLMNYFADQEVLLPAMVREFYKLEDRLQVDKEMVQVFMGGELTRRNKEEAHHNLILLIRWIANPRQLRAWIGKNLNSNARAMYATWYSMYQEEHFQLVKRVRNRTRNGLAVGS